MVVAVAVAVAVAELVVGSLAFFSPGVTTTTGGRLGVGVKGVVTRGTSFYNKKQSPPGRNPWPDHGLGPSLSRPLSELQHLLQNNHSS